MQTPFFYLAKLTGSAYFFNLVLHHQMRHCAHGMLVSDGRISSLNLHVILRSLTCGKLTPGLPAR
jgi:hypothetical protein